METRELRSMSRQVAGVLAACVVLLTATVAVWADGYVYNWNGTNFYQVAKIKSETQTAIMCRDGNPPARRPVQRLP